MRGRLPAAPGVSLGALSARAAHACRPRLRAQAAAAYILNDAPVNALQMRCAARAT
jgi:hypothetical protein